MKKYNTLAQYKYQTDIHICRVVWNTRMIFMLQDPGLAPSRRRASRSAETRRPSTRAWSARRTRRAPLATSLRVSSHYLCTSQSALASWSEDWNLLLAAGTPPSTQLSHSDHVARPETLSASSKVVSRSSSRQHTNASRASALQPDSDVMSNATSHSKANVGFLKSQLSAYSQNNSWL